jgi:Arc/MetJ-type ribon-helix-helix transcriptional regulator
MIRKIPDDVQAAIDEKVASGQYADEEAVLREAMASLREFDENVADLQVAIDDWQAGDEGMPVDEAVELIRRSVEGKNR